MTETKKCPKCDGEMAQGTMMEIGKYGNSPFLFAPANEAPFPVKGAPVSRKNIIVFRCERCGYLEFYAP
jgi:predicted nucleic-acid-binding Zn-ribbon protein